MTTTTKTSQNAKKRPGRHLHIIDTNADPIVPIDGYTIAKHIKAGKHTWEKQSITLYLTDEQRAGKPIDSKALLRRLRNKAVLNANVMNYLVTHSHLIPADWALDRKGYIQDIYFWGTLYRDEEGDLVVGYINPQGGWTAHYICVEGNVECCHAAALYAK